MVYDKRKKRATWCYVQLTLSFFPKKKEPIFWFFLPYRHVKLIYFPFLDLESFVFFYLVCHNRVEKIENAMSFIGPAKTEKIASILLINVCNFCCTPGTYHYKWIENHANREKKSKKSLALEYGSEYILKHKIK